MTEPQLTYLISLPEYLSLDEDSQKLAERAMSVERLRVCIQRDENSVDGVGVEYVIVVPSKEIDYKLLAFVDVRRAIEVCGRLGLHIISVDAPESMRRPTPDKPTYRAAMRKKMIKKYGPDYQRHIPASFEEGSDGVSSHSRVSISMEHTPTEEESQ